MELIQQDLTEQIIGCAIRVHKALGPGFLEKIYEEALCIELAEFGLRVERQKLVVVTYGGQPVGEHRRDLLAGGVVPVGGLRISIWRRLVPI